MIKQIKSKFHKIKMEHIRTWAVVYMMIVQTGTLLLYLHMYLGVFH